MRDKSMDKRPALGKGLRALIPDAPEVRLAGRLDGRVDVAIGDPVHATFTELGDGAALPQWHHGIHPDD